jgi:hypothetical protein
MWEEAMSDQPSSFPGARRSWFAPGHAGWMAAGFAAGGLGLLAMAAGMTVIAALQPNTPDHKFEPGLNGPFIGIIGLAVFGAFALQHAFFLLQHTRRVDVDAGGITIDSYLGRRFVRWNEVARVSRGKRTSLYGASTATLELLDTGGRTRAAITDTIGGLEELAQAVAAQVHGGEPAVEEKGEDARRASKEARKLRLCGWAFLAFALGMMAGLGAGINEELHTRRYATEGVRVEAKVVRTWMLSVTPYVEFSFQDQAGATHTREAMMFSGPEWQAVQGSATVPVEYLRGDPEWNRLVKGEDAGPSFGGSFLWLSSFGVLMFGGLALLCLSGYNIDSENGVTRVTRHGKLIQQWGQPR